MTRTIDRARVLKSVDGASLALPRAVRCAVSPAGTSVAHCNRSRVQVMRIGSGSTVLEVPVKDVTRLLFLDEDRVAMLTTSGWLSMCSVRSGAVVWREAVADSEPFGGMVLTKEGGLLVGHGSQIAVVDIDTGRVSARHPVPGRVHGFAGTAHGRIVVSLGAMLGVFADDGSIEPLLDLPGGYLGVRAVSPSGRFVYGFHGLDHTLIDLSTKTTLAVHRGLGHVGLFLGEDLLVDRREGELVVSRGPRWERIGAIALQADSLAASTDGRVLAVVGSAKGFVCTREELLSAAKIS